MNRIEDKCEAKRALLAAKKKKRYFVPCWKRRKQVETWAFGQEYQNLRWLQTQASLLSQSQAPYWQVLDPEYGMGDI